jgi:osmoprotectant transport system permease protein
MNLLWNYLCDSTHWNSDGGITQRLSEHVVLSLGALLFAGVIALPMGVVIGHSRRGDDLPILLGVLGRWLPPLGVLAYFAMKVDIGDNSAFLVLVLLAMPPMMSAGYAGVRLIDRSVVESGRAAGMLPSRVLREIEIPMAMPELVLGVRRAAAQVVAMTALAGYVGTGGLGRMIIDGQSAAVHDYGEVATGGVMLALLAVLLDAAIAAFGSGLIPPGLRAGLPAVVVPAASEGRSIPAQAPPPVVGASLR